MAAVLSLLVAFLYSRRHGLQVLVVNTPIRLQHLNLLTNYSIRFKDIVRNCEDVVLNEEASWAILSCDPGRDNWNTVMVGNLETCEKGETNLVDQGTFNDSKSPADTGLYLYHYGNGHDTQPAKIELLDFKGRDDFHPLGVEYYESTLFVVNHAAAGSRIEVFKLLAGEHTATHVRTIRHPLLNTPNSVAVLSATELLVTNDHYFQKRYAPLLADMETWTALPFASVVHVKLGQSPQDGNVTKLASLPFANGIALLNTTHFAVASSSGAAVHIYTSPSGLEVGADDVVLCATITVPFAPDNLSANKDGSLLIAGHAYPPALTVVAQNNARCNQLPGGDAKGCDVRSPSWIAEWSPEHGLKDLYVGTKFSSSSTAVKDSGRGFGMAVGLYERGILTWESSM